MKEWTITEWETISQNANVTAYYLYTPLCGTCKIASKMMDVVENLLPNVKIGKANLNFLEHLADDQQIESVPCLLISENGQITEKIYAFHSVPYLYNRLRKNI